MGETGRRRLRLAALFLLCSGLLSCAQNNLRVGNALIRGRVAEAKEVVDGDIRGYYTLILFGCNHSEDLETFAVLDKEDDSVILVPYASNFNYRVKKGLTAQEALEEAAQFVQCHSSFREALLKRLVNKKGATIGYEFRPQYLPLTVSMDDITESNVDIYSFRLKKGIARTNRR